MEMASSENKNPGSMDRVRDTRDLAPEIGADGGMHFVGYGGVHLFAELT